MRTLAVFHNDRRSLKENCGDIGAKQMASLCASLEKCAKEDRIEKAVLLLEKLEPEFAHLKKLPGKRPGKN